MTMVADRVHRFPPLSHLNAGNGVDAAPGPGGQGSQATFAEAFQQGLDAGHTEGYESGMRIGRETGHSEGLKAGRDEGVALGVAQAQARFASLGKPVDALYSALQQLQNDYQTAVRNDVVDLVAKVSRQVIRAELALAPAQMLKLVDETLLSLPPTPDGDIQVFLNPEELARIKELDPERAARWRLIGDGQLEPGECRVRCGDREADAGCKQRLVAVMEQVSAQLHGEGA